MFGPLKMSLRGFVRRILPGRGSKKPLQVPGMDNNKDKRVFDRYQITFPVRVSGRDAQNRAFEEITRLQDFSGSGAFFFSRLQGRYRVGQDLEISILLDGAEDVRACIRNQAGVVRIHPPAAVGSSPDAGLEGIAVTFYHAFDFHRMAPEDSGCL